MLTTVSARMAAGLASLGLLTIALVIEPGSAAAAAADNPLALGDTKIYNASFRALVVLFVLAILIESALAVIFNWRLFLLVFNGRGVKTVVMFAVSLFVVYAFDFNVLGELMDAYGVDRAKQDQTIGRILTALILAGGSGGVYRIMVKLGYREAKTAEQISPKPKAKKAWVAVRVERDKAVGDIKVHLNKKKAVTASSPPMLAGMISRAGFWRSVRLVFLRDRTRFPQSGGYEVETGFEYELTVVAKDAADQAIPCPIDDTYNFAEKAIIDFEVTL